MEDFHVLSTISRIILFLKNVTKDLVTSPLNLCLLLICLILIYKIIRLKKREEAAPIEPHLPPLKKRDFTYEELKEYDGCGPDGRILVAVNGKVFDVTQNGKDIYGPGGPYQVFKGRDASRALATFSVDKTALRDHYDDLSDLRSDQMESLKEWELQFREKYDYIGKLLLPGQNYVHYSDLEDDPDYSEQTSTRASSNASNQKSKEL